MVANRSDVTTDYRRRSCRRSPAKARRARGRHLRQVENAADTPDISVHHITRRTPAAVLRWSVVAGMTDAEPCRRESSLLADLQQARRSGDGWGQRSSDDTLIHIFERFVLVGSCE